jgi:hypothetical protein
VTPAFNIPFHFCSLRFGQAIQNWRMRRFQSIMAASAFSRNTEPLPEEMKTKKKERI